MTIKKDTPIEGTNNKTDKKEWKRRVRGKQVANLKSNICTYVIIGIAVLYVLLNMGNEGLNFIFNYSSALVVSGSMLPVLQINDLVIVKKVDNYEVGDIVCYQKGDDIIIHRIIEITDEGYVLKGDNNSIADPGIVTRDQILARYEFTIPYIGTLTAYLNSYPIAYIFIGIIGLYVLFEVILWLITRDKGKPQ